MHENIIDGELFGWLPSSQARTRSKIDCPMGDIELTEGVASKQLA